MSTSETLPTTYRNHTIDKETDPWHIKRGNKFRLYKGEFTGEPGTYWNAETIAEAKEIIDEAIEMKEAKAEPTYSPLSISGDVGTMKVILFGMQFYSDALDKICKENPLIIEELQPLRDEVKKIVSVAAQAHKDAQFEDTVGETKD